MLSNPDTLPTDALTVGQCQHDLFVRLLFQAARVIVLDEPFTAVDSHTIHCLPQLILRWNHDVRTVIAVLHDFDQIKSTFPQTLLLSHRVVAWGSTEEVLTENNLSKARALAEGGEVSTDKERRVAGRLSLC